MMHNSSLKRFFVSHHHQQHGFRKSDSHPGNDHTSVHSIPRHSPAATQSNDSFSAEHSNTHFIFKPINSYWMQKYHFCSLLPLLLQSTDPCGELLIAHSMWVHFYQQTQILVPLTRWTSHGCSSNISLKGMDKELIMEYYPAARKNSDILILPGIAFLTYGTFLKLLCTSNFDSYKLNRSVWQDRQSFQERLNLTNGILFLFNSRRKSFSCAGGKPITCGEIVSSSTIIINGSEQQKRMNMK